VLEDIPEVAKGYTVGDDIQFTAAFNAVFDPEKVETSEEAAEEAEPVAEESS
jgi:hypothetical protein